MSWAKTGHEFLGCACGRTIMLALPVIRNCGGTMSRDRTKSEVQERLAYIESGLELLHGGKLVHLPGTCLGRKVRRYFVRTTRIAEVSGAPQRLDAHRRGYQGSAPKNINSFWISHFALASGPRSALLAPRWELLLLMAKHFVLDCSNRLRTRTPSKMLEIRNRTGSRK